MRLSGYFADSTSFGEDLCRFTLSRYWRSVAAWCLQSQSTCFRVGCSVAFWPLAFDVFASSFSIVTISSTFRGSSICSSSTINLAFDGHLFNRAIVSRACLHHVSFTTSRIAILQGALSFGPLSTVFWPGSCIALSFSVIGSTTCFRSLGVKQSRQAHQHYHRDNNWLLHCTLGNQFNVTQQIVRSSRLFRL